LMRSGGRLIGPYCRVDAKVKESDAGVLRHVEVRRVAFCSRGHHCFREFEVGPFPRTAVHGHSTERRIALEPRMSFAAVGKLCDALRRNRNVPARQEHCRARLRRSDRQTGEATRTIPVAAEAARVSLIACCMLE